MADKKISDLEVLTNTLTPESKLEVSYTDDTITSPVTRAVTVEQIAETVLQEVELASELETEAKNIVDAINEVNEKAEQGGGGGSGTVTDVRVDSKSFLGEDGVVNISLGGQFPQGGGLKVWEASGTQPQRLGIIEPHQMEIINRNSGEMHQTTRAVTLSQLDYAVKRALTDGSGTEYTEEEQAAARERLGISEGGSTVTMSDNESGGVDLTVEGTTKTLAKEADLTDVNNALSTLNNTLNNLYAEDILQFGTLVVGKYYDGNEGTNSNYNYYKNIEVVKGAKYRIYPRARMLVIKNGDSTVQRILNDLTEFVADDNGTAYVTVYASDTNLSMFFSDTDTTLSKNGKSADSKVVGDRLSRIDNFVTYNNLFGYANQYVEGKYYDGTAKSSSSYNYYSEIPINKGDSYKFTEQVRFVCIKVGNTQKALLQELTEFTSDYDGVAYVTIYASKPNTKMCYNNAYHYASTISDEMVNGRSLSFSNNNTFGEQFNFNANEGDVIHFKCISYSGTKFANCIIYGYISNSWVIHNVIYSSSGDVIFKAKGNITQIKIYATLSSSESATFKYTITNLSENTVLTNTELLAYKIKSHSNLLLKKIACLGDSFTYGDNTYVSKMKRDFYCISVNYGVPSSRIVRDIDGVDSFNTRYSNMDDGADIITIFGGINDSWDLGNGDLILGDMTSPIDLTTFYGGMRKLIEGLILKYPTKQIIGIIPPDCQTGYYVSNLPIIQEAEREIYNYYGIPFIDLKKECFKMSTKIPRMIELYRSSSTDIHPSDDGQEALKDTIASGIVRYIS